ncbi:Hypothetical protein PEIBARAKI_5976 [Petrimonas sp. IBARAKI]|nr:Hypothetical protein PEIBARAKI_5976 [Petrimonas sp. IBARAKI]
MDLLIFRTYLTFNRTIVELKFLDMGKIGIKVQTFNRTIVELKFMSKMNFAIALRTFNRTIVELKYQYLTQIYLLE